MTANDLREQYELALSQLQENCKHEESKWIANVVVLGIVVGAKRICDCCEKVLEHSKDKTLFY